MEEAVTVSERSGFPKVVIGATVVSLGTTLPEAVVSVLAAIQGSPDIALGNAVGSIICDTGMILGSACLISPLQLDRKIVNRQGWFQLFAGLLLVAAAFPFAEAGTVFTNGGRLPRVGGFIFLGLLALYIWKTIAWSRGDSDALPKVHIEGKASNAGAFIKLLLAIIVVVGSSWVLIPAVKVIAVRAGIPQSIMPELVTAVSAARKGHGDLAIGNIIGADILNVLFVAGAAAAVTAGGLQAPHYFFTILFPAMLVVLIVFRIGVMSSGTHLKRPFGVVLLLTYIACLIASLTTKSRSRPSQLFTVKLLCLYIYSPCVYFAQIDSRLLEVRQLASFEFGAESPRQGGQLGHGSRAGGRRTISCRRRCRARRTPRRSW